MREVLKEDSPHEVDYVLNNMSKIDVDSNGCIDYPEFVKCNLNLGDVPSQEALRLDSTSENALEE